MARGFSMRAALSGALALMLFCCTSCVYVNVGDSTTRCEKVVPLAAPLEAGSSFLADTDDGSIRLQGTQTSECTLQATIAAHARTEERAQELIEQIGVRLEATDKGLQVVIDRPPVIRNAWFSVSLQGSLPTQTNLILSTSDGSIDIANITGTVEARTSDGSIEATDIDGDTRLRTSDGSITCARLKGQTLDSHTSDGRIHLSDVTVASVRANSSDGSITIEGLRAGEAEVRTNDGTIRIEYTPDAPKALHVTATTSDGSITLVTPPGLSAAIDASTNDGWIQTDLPITIRGKVGKSLSGAIGDGEGRIYLKTSDGSITIR
ncbi:MAG TPA: DUF4097 family beta strand repeat-containing protein [Sedimentisphaerales bacterium]|nr:DUF4097 family beta strand repeat-containing protein [Sedimentisphaerales bacterium]HNU27998.1 DUF4097 family beta strand repeat-containing protein [Sedimentisphaerales bacterium]